MPKIRTLGHDTPTLTNRACTSENLTQSCSFPGGYRYVKRKRYSVIGITKLQAIACDVGGPAGPHERATPNSRLRRIRSADMALPPKEAKTPLWLYAVGIAVGFALGAGLALLFIR
jgi:hypothetical protein